MPAARFQSGEPQEGSFMDRPFEQKTIGILGGMSSQATAEYYRLLNFEINQRLGGWDIAETLVAGLNFGDIEYFIRNEKWDEAGEHLAAKAMALQSGGADFLICVSNTMHRVSDRFTRDLTIPFLHIADPTGTAIAALGLTRVGLLGTKPVMSASFLRDYYKGRFGVDVVVPDESDQIEVDRVIFEELVRGRCVEQSKQFYLAVCDRLQELGAQGVILGCTEIPLLISQVDLPQLPCFDTTKLHVAAAVEMALAPRAEGSS
jgi:aspartate racemase